MSRITVAMALTLASLVVYPTEGYAKEEDHGWWGWLEQFSGPGPFTARSPWFNRHVTFACKSERVEEVQKRIMASPVPAPGAAELPLLLTTVQFVERTDNGVQLFGTPVLATDSTRSTRLDVKNCFYLDQTTYRAKEGRGFLAMKADSIEFGMTMALPGPFDIGAGFGGIRFRADKGGDPEWKWLVTPLRFQVRPLYMVERTGKYALLRRLLNSPKLYAKLSAVVGRLDAEDFVLDQSTASPSGASEFRSPGELVTSYGFVFDFGELLGFVKDAADR